MEAAVSPGPAAADGSVYCLPDGSGSDRAAHIHSDLSACLFLQLTSHLVTSARTHFSFTRWAALTEQPTQLPTSSISSPTTFKKSASAKFCFPPPHAPQPQTSQTHMKSRSSVRVETHWNLPVKPQREKYQLSTQSLSSSDSFTRRRYFRFELFWYSHS